MKREPQEEELENEIHQVIKTSISMLSSTSSSQPIITPPHHHHHHNRHRHRHLLLHPLWMAAIG